MLAYMCFRRCSHLQLIHRCALSPQTMGIVESENLVHFQFPGTKAQGCGY